MNINLITLATVKTQLGISGTDDDASITAMIPIVSSDVRRILNNRFDGYVTATVTSGSTDLTISATYFRTYTYSTPQYDPGQVIAGDGITDDTNIESFDRSTSVYTMSETATADGDFINPTLIISQWPAVSKMIWYRISGQNKTSVSDKNVASERFGPVSKTYADSEINKKYNYPSVLIEDLGTPYARVG